ncbi:outer membrane protein assembly factor BamE [Candidatus Erwinia haradaeae]|uniref:Outer membrane protein assembly factor BamE n=1 Tax=Candidatus Erwinia haradaeae TaxID=1922217 RepID=A0A451D1L7_9GAMM|nr:outer membrane protein assembly factor BamE [Candidatus Erwinia haradaeae]VFP79501.1 Outer membrane protein assembly factor BamE [Candidatus Erwinia haradaeae]
MIRYIIFAFIAVYWMILSGCSTLEKIVYHPNLIQGNYLVAQDVKKIHIGMNQKQVLDILGAPIVKNLFSKNIWYYIYRISLQNHSVHQQTLTLIFNSYGILIKIDNSCINNE